MSASNEYEGRNLESKLRAIAWLSAFFCVAFSVFAVFVKKIPFADERGESPQKENFFAQDGADASPSSEAADEFSEYSQNLLAHQALLKKERERIAASGKKYAEAVVKSVERNFERNEFLRRERLEADEERERRSKSSIFKEYSPYELEALAQGAERKTQGDFDLQGEGEALASAENFADSVESELKSIESADRIAFSQAEEILGFPQDIAVEGQKVPSIFEKNDVAAFYGNPKSAAMGILGRLSLEELERELSSFAAEYDAANGERDVIPCVYLVYGTCWKGGEIGCLDDGTVEKYISFAQERGWLVVLDHQIGKLSVKSAVEKMLPFLRHENVHLAIDPEWKTERPMKEIGSVAAQEINEAQSLVDSYLESIGSKSKRFLVVHQFVPKMIREPEKIIGGGRMCELVHCMDGFGSPSLKRASYAMNSLAEKMPLKSFKLFSEPAIANAGKDEPLMSASEVMALRPKPVLVILQ